MKFEYYPETDSGYLGLVDEIATETYQILDGVNADFNADGALVGIEIECITPSERQPDGARRTRIVSDSVIAAAGAATYAYLAGRSQGKSHDEARRAAIAIAADASIKAAELMLQAERAAAVAKIVLAPYVDAAAAETILDKPADSTAETTRAESMQA